MKVLVLLFGLALAPFLTYGASPTDDCRAQGGHLVNIFVSNKSHDYYVDYFPVAISDSGIRVPEDIYTKDLISGNIKREVDNGQTVLITDATKHFCWLPGKYVNMIVKQNYIGYGVSCLINGVYNFHSEKVTVHDGWNVILNYYGCDSWVGTCHGLIQSSAP